MKLLALFSAAIAYFKQQAPKWGSLNTIVHPAGVVTLNNAFIFVVAGLPIDFKTEFVVLRLLFHRTQYLPTC